MAEPTDSHIAVTSPDPQGPAGHFSVEETARRLGHYKWTEMRLFELLGGWVATVPEPEVKLRLGTHCYHHAWHAELWHKRLPQVREVAPNRLTAPPNEAYVAFVEALAEPAAPEQTIEKLVGLYRVLLPRLIAAYSFHLDHTSVVTDGPTIRSLKFCLQDDLEEWREGEALLHDLLVGGAEIDRAATHQARLERLVVEAGGVAGPGSTRWSGPGSQPVTV